ncbi:MAG: SusC/RagA family TonB-linked outer membrane protein, partial [Rikenellaceae bacterium]|nr:SusC/RagA family TonB-linked outer membrane protein [Rikenellaceae bacterium]
MLILQETVTDPAKKPIPGAYVVLEGSVYGTVTDQAGKYMFRFPAQALDGAPVIVFSMMGMEPLKVNFTGQTVLDATLREDSKAIDEVVVTGYQTISRKDMVGAFTQLKADDILISAYSSIDKMLQGQVAGLIVTSPSIRAGSTSKVTLRGTSTLLGSSEPLWVVDGIIQQDMGELNGNSLLTGIDDLNVVNEFLGNQISWLNPNDIETITVLKDASATALYGSRASNGVIVITTKRGTSDRTNINFSSNFSLTLRPTYENYYLMNSKDRINFSKDEYDAGNRYSQLPIEQIYSYEGLMYMFLNGKITEEYFASQYAFLETTNTDWLKTLTRNTFSQNYNLSVSGGTSNVTYRTSMSYYKQNGIEKGNDTERLSGRINVGVKLSDRVRFEGSLSGTYSTTTGYAVGVNPLTYAITTSRAIPLYDQAGNPVFYQQRINYTYNTNTQQSGLPYNILNEMENTYSQVTNPMVQANLTFQWEVLPEWLKYEFTGGIGVNSKNVEAYASENSTYVARYYKGYLGTTADSSDEEYNAVLLPFGGELNLDHSQLKTWELQNKLIFSRTFNQVHSLNAMAAFELRSSERLSKFTTVYGYDKIRGQQVTRPNGNIIPIGSASVPDLGIFERLYNGGFTSTDYTTNELNIFATLAYSYNNRYVVNANLRNDMSNTFGIDQSKRFDPTYSLGFMWRMTEEPFMEGKARWLDLLSIRATYGLQGNALEALSPDMLFYIASADPFSNQI